MLYSYSVTINILILTHSSDRLECWHTFKGAEINILLLFEFLLQFVPKLERLVVHGKTRKGEEPIFWEHFTDLSDYLIDFVSKMGNLVAFCFTGFDIQPFVLEAVRSRLSEEILPNRPSLWFYFGRVLPNANDPSVPRVHYDEIVNPIDPFNALPMF